MKTTLFRFLFKWPVGTALIRIYMYMYMQVISIPVPQIFMTISLSCIIVPMLFIKCILISMSKFALSCNSFKINRITSLARGHWRFLINEL